MLGAQVHINSAGDWTGALHACFCAGIQLARSDKRTLVTSLSQALQAHQSLKHNTSRRLGLSRSSQQACSLLSCTPEGPSPELLGPGADSLPNPGTELLHNLLRAKTP